MPKYAFQLRAAGAEAAQGAVAEKLNELAGACNVSAAASAACALIDGVGEPGAGEEILVVINGVAAQTGDRCTEESLGISVYLVQAEERVIEEPAVSLFVPPDVGSTVLAKAAEASPTGDAPMPNSGSTNEEA